jgi:hypothetical protein
MLMADVVWKKMMDEMGSPCVGCEHHDACRDHELACEQFQNYVETGEIELVLPKIPTKQIFMEIYFEEKLEGEF